MNKYYAILLTLVLTGFLQGCNTKKEEAGQSTDSTTTANSVTETASDISISGRLADLGLTTNSDWRGISLGDEFGKVKATEKGEAFENDVNHIGYTVEFKNLETADMLYYQSNQKVSAIDVDLFLNSRQSVDSYQKELTSYFSAKYGSAKPSNGGTIWAGKNGAIVTLKDVSKGKDFGLKVRIAPAGNNATASTK